MMDIGETDEATARRYFENGGCPQERCRGHAFALTHRIDALAAELDERTKANQQLAAIRQSQYDRIATLEALLRELTDIEGPQPGHVEWYRRVQAAIGAQSETACVHEYTEGWDSHCKHCGNRGFAPPDRGEKR